MRQVYIRHDASTLAAVSNIDAPGCDGVIIKLGEPQNVLAHTIGLNPLRDQWLLDLESPGKRAVAWSGTLADELFEAHPMTWLSPGHQGLSIFCDEVAPQLEAHGRTICFQPHARHVLNDVQSTLNFLKKREGQPFEVALNPVLLLEASMMSSLDEHLERIYETLGGLCSMLILSDVLVQDEGTQPVPLGEGDLPHECLLELIEQHVPAETPLVLLPQYLDRQLGWLEPVVKRGAED